MAGAGGIRRGVPSFGPFGQPRDARDEARCVEQRPNGLGCLDTVNRIHRADGKGRERVPGSTAHRASVLAPSESFFPSTPTVMYTLRYAFFCGWFNLDTLVMVYLKAELIPDS